MLGGEIVIEPRTRNLEMEDDFVVSALYGVCRMSFRRYVVCNCYMGDVAFCWA